MKPERIQRKRTKGWRMPPNTVSVTRPTKYGNGFKIGMSYQITLATDNPIECRRVMERHQRAEPRVRFYRSHPSWTFYRFDITDNYSAVLAYRLFVERYCEPDFAEPLRGQNLACFCKLSDPCHADVLLEMANK